MKPVCNGWKMTINNYHFRNRLYRNNTSPFDFDITGVDCIYVKGTWHFENAQIGTLKMPNLRIVPIQSTPVISKSKGLVLFN